MSVVARDAARVSAVEDVCVPLPSGFRLGCGAALEDREIRARLFGCAELPMVLAMGGISSTRDVCGARGWWRETLDGVRQNHCILGLDLAPLGDQRVAITPFDQAKLVALVLDHLQAPRLQAFLGASYGAMVGLALAALAPERIERLCVISAAHRPSALASAWRGVQRRTVAFGLSHCDGAGGLALARQLAMITYRTGGEFEARFGGGVDESGVGAVDRYLEARGEAYARAVSPQRWLSLSESIDRFAVTPEQIATPTTLVACPDDQLAPMADMEELARRLPRLRRFHTLPSRYGHDAFLKEPQRLGAIIRDFLEDDLT